MRKIIIIGVFLFVIFCIGYYISKRDYFDEENYMRHISYVVPKEFESNNYSMSRYYHYYKDMVDCDFEVHYFDIYSYSDGKEYLEDNVSIHLNDDVSDVKEVDLNGDMWYYFSKKNRGDISYYYAIVKDNYGYYLEYSIGDYLNGDYGNGEGDFCMSSYDNIISSVKLK